MKRNDVHADLRDEMFNVKLKTDVSVSYNSSLKQDSNGSDMIFVINMPSRAGICGHFRETFMHKSIISRVENSFFILTGIVEMFLLFVCQFEKSIQNMKNSLKTLRFDVFWFFRKLKK